MCGLIGLGGAADRDGQALADLDRVAAQLVALAHGGDRRVVLLRDGEERLAALHAVDDPRRLRARSGATGPDVATTVSGPPRPVSATRTGSSASSPRSLAAQEQRRRARDDRAAGRWRAAPSRTDSSPARGRRASPSACRAMVAMVSPFRTRVAVERREILGRRVRQARAQDCRPCPSARSGRSRSSAPASSTGAVPDSGPAAPARARRSTRRCGAGRPAPSAARRR